MKRPGLSKIEVAALADFLANMHDLPVADLGGEFKATMSASFPGLEVAYLDFLFSQFSKLGVEERFDVYFDHCAFVRESFDIYRAK